MSLFLFDIDGTIANNEHRVHLIKTKGWDAFFDACGEDLPITHMLELLGTLLTHDDQTINVALATGRPQRVIDKTRAWIEAQLANAGFVNGISNFPIFGRKDGDHRPDDVVKKELIAEITKFYDEPITMVFDDRTSVVKMWRAAGIPCAQVVSEEDGNF